MLRYIQLKLQVDLIFKTLKLNLSVAVETNWVSLQELSVVKKFIACVLPGT